MWSIGEMTGKEKSGKTGRVGKIRVKEGGKSGQEKASTSRPRRLKPAEWHDFGHEEVREALLREGAPAASLPPNASPQEVWEVAVEYVGDRPGAQEGIWFIEKYNLEYQGPPSRGVARWATAADGAQAENFSSLFDGNPDPAELALESRNGGQEKNSPIEDTDAVPRGEVSGFSSDSSEGSDVEDSVVVSKRPSGTAENRVGSKRKRTNEESRGENSRSSSIGGDSVESIVASTLRGIFKEMGMGALRNSFVGDGSTGTASSSDDGQVHSSGPSLASVVDSLPRWDNNRLERSFRNFEGHLTVYGVARTQWAKCLARVLESRARSTDGLRKL